MFYVSILRSNVFINIISLQQTKSVSRIRSGENKQNEIKLINQKAQGRQSTVIKFWGFHLDNEGLRSNMATGSLSNLLVDHDQGHCGNSKTSDNSLISVTKLARSGSMPCLKLSFDVPVLKQTPFFLVTVLINDDPLKLIREENPELKLNGFYVTLDELAAMYQVVGCFFSGIALAWYKITTTNILLAEKE